MNGKLLKNIKEKIENQFIQLCKANYLDAGHELRIFYNYLLSNQFIRSALEKLNVKTDEYLININLSKEIIFTPKNEFEKQYMSYALIKKCVEDKRNYPQWEIVKRLNKRLANLSTEKSIEYFNSTFVHTIFQFLKESINDNDTILLLLLKYKQKCEWFQRQHLNQMIEQNSKTAENLLISNLFEYLFDEGLQLYIEPKSASGKPDLISSQISGDRLIAEAKIFNPSNGKDRNYIANGFKQIYDYTQDFNEAMGYLVIFKTCKYDLNFSLTNTNNHIPYLVYNNKIIYAITIDIHNYEKTASKRGKPKCYIMDETFIVQIVSND